MTTESAALAQRSINAIRFLSVDGVNKANSGHPGAPMGAAPMAYVLWKRFMKHNPRNPQWADRDRFVLSMGHASMLLYSMLHLTGYDLSLDDLKQFRQWDSKTPGHPEAGHTPGVEVTTGPLGQGFCNGVGMAMAEAFLAAKFNKPDFPMIDHYTYALVSDGDLQEGITSEAASFAGTLKLGKLIYLYDSNRISIEGDTDITFREDVAARFRAYGWQVLGPVEGHDIEALTDLVREAKADTGRPTLIICKTIIGFGCSEQGTAKVHGEPLGQACTLEAKKNLGWPEEPTFHVPDDVLAHMREVAGDGEKAEAAWQQRFDAYADAYPELAAELERVLKGELPAGWDAGIADLFPAGSKPVATRAASGKVINFLADRIPELMGGSADLAPSTKTLMDKEASFTADNHGGRNLHFGIREHAMGSIANGMARHGGVIPYTATFLIFSDYMRPTLRLASLMHSRVVHVFTHDSIGVGEDGPTHEPIEQIMSMRMIPGYTVIRPADAAETAEAWRAALLHTGGPTTLALSRQNLPVYDRTVYAPATGLHQGAYVLTQTEEGTPDVILIGTGSEVQLCVEAADLLVGDGLNVRIVSMPCWELFEKQSKDYKDSVLPPAITARVAVEAGVTLGWERYVGCQGAVVGIDHFGASAPGPLVMEKFGFTPENVANAARKVLGK